MMANANRNTANNFIFGRNLTQTNLIKMKTERENKNSKLFMDGKKSSWALTNS
jgi:hypothetical protein